ncbi:hypothetical protein EMPG_13767 [Blastomyces silverae]|uniref:C3H1-type domain-containing protein n=1 Tax=Blastomyces silverae TaxID=2060906 RepID=A0A0H1BHE2_9EURO|nr:hypothetical protein EMPG_13767 [Blastomyces silverae]
MVPNRASKKAITCYYWHDGRCKYTADACMYAHRDTDQVAKKPPSTAKSGMDTISLSFHIATLFGSWARHLPVSETKSNQRDTIDLISLVGNDDIIEVAISNAATENSPSKIKSTTPAEGSECLTLAEAVIRALQSNTDFNGIKHMLDTNPPERVHKALNKGIDGFSAIFEAVKRNDPDIIKLLVENGANPNATEHNSDIPLLAFAILQEATITVVQTLLSLGANPHSIPRDLWDGGNCKTFGDDDESLTGGDSTPLTLWCSSIHCASLLKRMDFGLKYHLLASSKLIPLTKQERQNADIQGTISLLQAPYFLIGQSLAIKRVTEYVQSHLLLPNSNGPLLLAFVGPPGHGQVQLATRVGKVISLNAIVTRMKKMNKRSVTERIASKEVSTRQPGGLEVVYIDDLDKIGRSNLVTLLDGPPQGTDWDKTNSSTPANSKTICILSVTDGETTILDFYARYLRNASKSELHSAPWNELDKALKKDLIKSYGSSLTSHVDAIIPFFPYSSSETDVLAYKYIHDLRSRLATTTAPCDNGYPAKPAATNASVFLGPIHLDLEGDDKAICTYIAEKSYDMSLGERSIQQAVIREIQLPIIEQWMKRKSETEERLEGHGHGQSQAQAQGQAQWCSGLDLRRPFSSSSNSISGSAHALSAKGVTKAVVKLLAAKEYPDFMGLGRNGRASISVSLE